MALLGSSVKVEKGEAFGYLTAILYLAPAWLSGWNVCPGASAGCVASCLNTSGRGRFTKTQAARIRKTKLFFANRAEFMAQLVIDVARHVKRARRKGLIPVVRLNGTSDIRWELIPVTVAGVEYPNIMAVFPDIQFYDYTKLSNRRDLPPNYHLTFSRSESNDAGAVAAIANGMNVAVVFRNKTLPNEWYGIPVFNGDTSDLRFLDPKGVIVGLYAKGDAKRDTSGFVIDA